MTATILVLHLLAALLALPLGAWQLFRSAKGSTAHRLVGRVWVGLMVWVALSSFALRDLNHGSFSVLHVLSVVTLVSMVLGVWGAVRGDIRSHRGSMTGSWIGLVGAFVGAVAVPDRAIPTFAVEQPAGALAIIVAIAATTWLVVRLGTLAQDRAQDRVERSHASGAGADGRAAVPTIEQ